MVKGHSPEEKHDSAALVKDHCHIFAVDRLSRAESKPEFTVLFEAHIVIQVPLRTHSMHQIVKVVIHAPVVFDFAGMISHPISQNFVEKHTKLPSKMFLKC